MSFEAIPEPILTAATDLGLIVVEVPYSTPFAAVIKTVTARLAELEYAVLRAAAVTQGRITRAALRGGSELIVSDVRDPLDTSGIGPHNWQVPPYNRWALWHAPEFLPHQSVTHDLDRVREIGWAPTPTNVVDIALRRVNGGVSTVGEVMAATFTDAYVVVQDGALVAEWYGPEGGPHATHSLMSVTKSVVGCVAAALSVCGTLDRSAEITTYITELVDSGYAGATVGDVLDMRSGVRFREDYDDPESDIGMLGRWLGWTPGDSSRGLYAYLCQLAADGAHGGPFRYRSVETDVLGWVCERAAGIRMADLISELVWRPMGAENDAYLLCDALGTAVHDGGLFATARDIARFGQVLLDDGSVADAERGTRTVIDPRWIRISWAVDADTRAAFAASPAEHSMPGGWYRNQFWFRPGEQGDVLLALGIHGQILHVSRRTRTVCVKFSSWPQPQNQVFLQDTLRAFDAIGSELAGRPRTGDRHRLRGVVAGLSRTGLSERTPTRENGNLL